MPGTRPDRSIGTRTFRHRRRARSGHFAAGVACGAAPGGSTARRCPAARREHEREAPLHRDCEEQPHVWPPGTSSSLSSTSTYAPGRLAGTVRRELPGERVVLAREDMSRERQARLDAVAGELEAVAVLREQPTPEAGDAMVAVAREPPRRLRLAQRPRHRGEHPPRAGRARRQPAAREGRERLEVELFALATRRNRACRRATPDRLARAAGPLLMTLWPTPGTTSRRPAGTRRRSRRSRTWA